MIFSGLDKLVDYLLVAAVCALSTIVLIACLVFDWPLWWALAPTLPAVWWFRVLPRLWWVFKSYRDRKKRWGF